MIYLDNNATTRPDVNMLNSVTKVCSEAYGNPSSLHAVGRDSRSSIDDARIHVATAMGCEADEVVFTSGGTEANNIALGNPRALPVRIVRGSAVEHSSVYNCLSGDGFLLRVNEDGTLDLNYLEYKLKDSAWYKTAVVAVMLANNETGVILDPDRQVAGLCEKYGALYHIDAVQGFGKSSTDFSVKELGAHTVAISGHKIHALKGVGALYIRSDIRENISPIFRGGSHEIGMRPGTENQIGICSLGFICRKLKEDSFYKERVRDMKRKRDKLEKLLSDCSEVNGSQEHRIGNTTNLYFPEVTDLELFVDSLSVAGICVSGKSACSSGIPAPSRVLTAMFGEDSPRLEGSIRLSLSPYTTEGDIEQSASAIKDVVGSIKKML